MENNARASFKEKLFAMLLCLAFIMPLAPIVPQETDEVFSDDTWSNINWSDDTEEDSTGTAAANDAAPEETTGTTAVEEGPKTTAPKDAPRVYSQQTFGLLCEYAITAADTSKKTSITMKTIFLFI